MEEIDLNNWETFEEKLKIIENEHIKKGYSDKFLYRGQGNHIHSLKTTLERNGRECLSLKEYHHLIFMVRPQIESFTRVNWDVLLNPYDFNDLLKKSSYWVFHSREFQSAYSYMTYLRHYGFPSPLLDWTRSPYVAAFFAFRNASNCGEKVSIYVYSEMPSGLKSSSPNEPHICKLGPYVKTDRRHFVQQSQYTICVVNDNEWRYAPHEEAFAHPNPNQDVLWKINIPFSERLKVLKILDGYNINALSLLGSDESLMETMALRVIDLKD